MTIDGAILSHFGARVRELREARGMTQEQFAHACELDRTYVSGIERGKRNVSLRNIRRVADALGVSLAQLFEQM